MRPVRQAEREGVRVKEWLLFQIEANGWTVRQTIEFAGDLIDELRDEAARLRITDEGTGA